MQKLQSQIDLLQQNFENYQDYMGKTTQQIADFSNQLLMQMTGMLSHINALEIKVDVLKLKEENLKYELSDPRTQNQYFYPNIRSGEEAIQEIIQNGKSMARFGDGEFSLITNKARQKFQKADEKLARRLKEVLCADHPNMLTCIADNYGDLEKYNDSTQIGIREYMTQNGTRKIHMELLKHEKVYYDGYLSRPYVMYKDNMTEMPRKRFERLKEIWNDRNVIVVEGVQTRMGVGNDLLANAKEIKRILAPAVSAFDRYDDILGAALKNAKEDTLFLIAMGPAAGVLAYDLTIAGYQALDIGHLDLEYEWFLAGKGERVPVPFKYNNEMTGGDVVEDVKDSLYESQIIVTCI